MAVMLLVGLLVILVCLVFVKRDKTVTYNALDKVSAVLNYIVCLGAIPFIALVATLLQITMSGDEFVYQLFLCIPALTAFTVAASVALRRKGFSKSGFFVQFAGVVLFALSLIIDYTIY